jgi:hypothetical protein
MNNVLPGSEQMRPLPGTAQVYNVAGFFDIPADIEDRTPDVVFQTQFMQPLNMGGDPAVRRRIGAYQRYLNFTRPLTHTLYQLYRQHSPELVQGLQDNDTSRVFELDKHIIVPAGGNIF